MTTASPVLDVQRIRADFPILSTTVHGKPLVYLDNAASMQMPRQVIDRFVRYQSEEHANVHRGVHHLSQTATMAYEGARETVRAFINAASVKEVIFTRGATEGINLVMHAWGRSNVKAGDEIIVSTLEHHSNIVPWQMLCEDTGAKLRVIPINDAGELDMAAFQALLNAKSKLVAVNHVSNALGTINPVADIIKLAHQAGAMVLVDGAQAAPHLPIDVQGLGADFYVFSGHKLCGPTGIGILYGKQALLEAMKPFQGGGDMIRSVTFEKTTYNDLPYKFEAGTPAIAAAIALGSAIDYISAIGMDKIAAHEHMLLERATRLVGGLKGVRLIGTAKAKAAVLSFEVEGVHPHDVGTILDGEGIAVRAGHHCAQPLMDRLGVPATARASFAFYNTPAEVDALVRGIQAVQEIFA
ncbi:MAG: cysteine desulfurase [Cyanobacteria bacterium RYN_339]|nr:cysteine desulfurase [Cyanobacteria bacterium RYN_339]